MSTRVKRELIWMLVALVAGLVGMPLLVYATGRWTLGPYSSGGAAQFVADFLHSLARLEWQALALALAPIALVLAWRIVRALRAPPATDAGAERRAPVRREPTL